MRIEFLEWDSDFFEKRVGKIVLFKDDYFDECAFLESAREEHFDLIYIVKFDKMIPMKCASASGIELMDIQISMLKKFNRIDYVNSGYSFRRELSHKELLECYAVAEQTSVVSRFHREPLVGPSKTIKMYRKWIDNALNSSFSDGIFVEKYNNRIEGVHLIRTQSNKGYFTLTGVNQNLKGIGIGTKLWNQSYSYWAHNGIITSIESPFSFQNLESFNFHLRHKFDKITRIKYIYHYRKRN